MNWDRRTVIGDSRREGDSEGDGEDSVANFKVLKKSFKSEKYIRVLQGDIGSNR